MKILMLFNASPCPPDIGSAKRNFPFFLENIKRHEVSVLSFGTPEQERQLCSTYGLICKHIVFVNNSHSRIFNFAQRMWYFFSGRSLARWLYHSKFERVLQELLAKEKFDLLHSCTTLLGYHCLPNNIPLVGDAHNVEYDNIYRTYQQTKNPIQKWYYYVNYQRLKKEELDASRKFDVITTTTERDARILREVLPNKRIIAIPNGVDPAFYQNQNVQEQSKSIIFAGLMSYLPNNHGITYFLDEIFPLILDREPDARIQIVGAYPPKKLRRRANNNIVVTGWVDDIKPYFAHGQVFIIPLLIGGGIRGKALEAMAMRRPIVSTTLGCEGINLVNEESALFADTPQAFADAVIRMFKETSLRKRLTENAYKKVVEDHDWEKNGLKLDRVYQSLVRTNDSHGTALSNASDQKKSSLAQA